MAKSTLANAPELASEDFLAKLTAYGDSTSDCNVTCKRAPRFKINKHYSDLNPL